MLIKKIALCILFLLFCFGLALVMDIKPLHATGLPGEDKISLPLDEENAISMTKLLEVASACQKLSLLYDESETTNYRFQFTSKVEIPQSKFQGFFERLLLDKGFVYARSGEGPSAIHRVIQVSPAHHNKDFSFLKSAALFLKPDEIDAYAERAILVTVHIALKNLDSRSLIQSLNPYFMNSYYESVRTVDSKLVIITTVGQKAYQIVKLVETMDAESPRKIENAEKRISDLEARIKALENILADRALKK